MRRRSIGALLMTAALCCLPVAILLPLLFADTPCVQYSKNDVCSWSGCSKHIQACSDMNGNGDACLAYTQTSIQTGMFTCVTLSTANSLCDPAENADGSAKTTKCVRMWSCEYDSGAGKCQLGTEQNACQSPYYQTDPCPPGTGRGSNR
jgi:hypothetical protein